jgi:DNA ligase-1
VVESLRTASRAEVQRLIETWLDALDADGRWALLKLMTGGLRVGVSARLAKQACADFGQVEIGEIEEVWHAMSRPMATCSPGWRAARSSPRPTRRAASGR